MINKIAGMIPNTNREINIILNGRSLILTGPNGCGKTSCLRNIFQKCKELLRERSDHRKAELIQHIKIHEDIKRNSEPGSSEYLQREQIIIGAKEQLLTLESGLVIEINDLNSASQSIKNNQSCLLFFEATRMASINHADAARGIDSVRTNALSNPNLEGRNGGFIEQHLVNIKSMGSLSLTEKNDSAAFNLANEWIAQFEESLKFLLEDQTAKLDFDLKNLKYRISQNNKPLYTFQQLSSGYSAILDVYSELLIRSVVTGIPQDQLSGIVLIDEIDAHLHVSLQKKILPFYRQAFPRLQFIVTTHSPFIIMEAGDALLFDFRIDELVDANFSHYSYASIIEGLLGVDTVSEYHKTLIAQLANAVNAKMINYEKIELLTSKLDSSQSAMDPRSLAYYLLAKEALARRH